MPYELNDEIRPPVGFAILPSAALQVSVVAPAAICALTAAPSVLVMETTGMVTAGVPATVGFTAPATLL